LEIDGDITYATETEVSSVASYLISILPIVKKLVYICLKHNIEPRIWTPNAVAEAFIQTYIKIHFISENLLPSPKIRGLISKKSGEKIEGKEKNAYLELLDQFLNVILAAAGVTARENYASLEVKG